MMKTEELSLNRLGSKEAAQKVYAGVDRPLLAEDVADVVAFAISRPSYVNLDRIVIRPVARSLAGGRASSRSWAVEFLPTFCPPFPKMTANRVVGERKEKAPKALGSLVFQAVRAMCEKWAMRGSNPRHPRCKRGALAN